MMIIEPPFCDCDFALICEFWSCERPDFVSKSTLILTSFVSFEMNIR
ncbi:hypothetical protein LSS_04596 [Leptospira santarosai serovar Shermani str. LT 821]|uniref:Uncharacterized protein n=1 Tax=Leptospira santarosai serovar Shermani str. LT 821 TaxID=758847 RepID=K8Y4I8_9LEPT|nr:hypothetical protein LSS_04596 [Leptospira santarosai serovar Shermani str. LT 821]